MKKIKLEEVGRLKISWLDDHDVGDIHGGSYYFALLKDNKGNYYFTPRPSVFTFRNEKHHLVRYRLYPNNPEVIRLRNVHVDTEKNEELYFNCGKHIGEIKKVLKLMIPAFRDMKVEFGKSATDKKSHKKYERRPPKLRGD